MREVESFFSALAIAHRRALGVLAESWVGTHRVRPAHAAVPMYASGLAPKCSSSPSMLQWEHMLLSQLRQLASSAVSSCSPRCRAKTSAAGSLQVGDVLDDLDHARMLLTSKPPVVTASV